jgi:choline dehydrogenase-like flavoprotein
MKSFMTDLDARDYPSGITTDICIVGSGPAGAFVGCRLAESGADVVILESGGISGPNIEDSIADVHIDGKQGLSARRASIVGGSSNVWGGLVAPMEHYDFTHSVGWPIDYAAFTQYYQRACAAIGLNWDILAPKGTMSRAPYLETKRFDVSDPPFSVSSYLQNHIAKGHRGRLRLLSNATALKLHVGIDGRADGLDTADRSKTSLLVRAKIYVLAAGGIETPRILLLSNDTQTDGIGNQSDLVGRFLSTHPKCDLGTLSFGRRTAEKRPLFNRNGIPIALGLSEDRLRASDGLNHQLQFFPIWYSRVSSLVESAQRRAVETQGYMATTGSGAPRGIRRLLLKSIFPHFPEISRQAGVVGHFDQYPNSENRVRLSHSQDTFGRRKVNITWRLSDDDRDSIFGFVSQMKSGLGLSGQGELKEVTLEKIRAGDFIGFHSHHLGTTRMSQNARIGVTDEHCRIHSTPNVYISGPSVFPTFGFANPYLTIVAMALRLADHLLADIA